ncbi:rhodanese-like domain-containing protein [Botrimarina sp.]|uniref:rhodanese-like domain-containing protein n=1 Tax=Botrimarina sp. TaxID=2795802 RepID=UPI0032EC9510
MDEPSLELSCSELKQRLDAREALLLVDCREPEEHAIVRLGGSVLVPMAQVPGRLGELAADGRPVVVYCHHGMRSLQAVRWLREQGLADAQSLAGGIDAWSLEIDPAAPRY